VRRLPWVGGGSGDAQRAISAFAPKAVSDLRRSLTHACTNSARKFAAILSLVAFSRQTRKSNFFFSLRCLCSARSWDRCDLSLANQRPLICAAQAAGSIRRNASIRSTYRISPILGLREENHTKLGTRLSNRIETRTRSPAARNLPSRRIQGSPWKTPAVSDAAG
jgi:hypothetical protein